MQTMGNKVLIVDDMTERHDGLSREYSGQDIHHAYSYSEAVSYLDNNVYDLVCFDHDLNDFSDGSEKTGASVAKYMAYGGMICKGARVHSHNPIGAQNIISILRSGDVSSNIWYEPFAIFPGANMVGLKEKALQELVEITEEMGLYDDLENPLIKKDKE